MLLNVYIDGALVGHPAYNNYRADIATLFPGLNNSLGAIGYRVLNTATLSNGLHTIAWTATDNQGATEGMGSRYFRVANSTAVATAATRAARAAASAARPADLDAAALATVAANADATVRRGWDPDAPLERLVGGTVRGEELDRFELRSGRDRSLCRLPAGRHRIESAANRLAARRRDRDVPLGPGRRLHRPLRPRVCPVGGRPAGGPAGRSRSRCGQRATAMSGRRS